MSCRCNNKPNEYIDASNIDPVSWDNASALLGMDDCGNIERVEKPPFDFTEEDAQKLDKIVIDGDGESALYDDGTYKATYTKEQVDELAQQLASDIAEETEARVAADNEIRGHLDAIAAGLGQMSGYLPLSGGDMEGQLGTTTIAPTRNAVYNLGSNTARYLSGYFQIMYFNGLIPHSNNSGSLGLSTHYIQEAYINNLFLNGEDLSAKIQGLEARIAALEGA